MTAPILAIDTAGPVCTVALSHDGQTFERAADEPRAHARHVLAQVKAVLDEAGVTLAEVGTLAFGEGPGGLTGVRVAASVVQGFALATAARVAAVSNLHALAVCVAQDAAPGTRILIALEAGAGALCTQSYRTGGEGQLDVMDDRAVVAPEDVVFPDAPLCVAGSASGRLALPAGSAWWRGEPTRARARDLLRTIELDLAKFVEPEAAQPVYVRHPVDATITL